LAISTTTLGPDHVRRAIDLGNLGETLRRRGQFAAALPLFRANLDIYDRKYGVDYVGSWEPLEGLGESLTALGRSRQALPPLERALKLVESGAVQPDELASVRFALAQALWEANVDRSRSRLLAEKARDGFGSMKPARLTERDRVATWLSARGQ
jgi:hypothetical protein